ncbi:hypothetical protein NDU88_009815 [Pleurodeles waltl]|uniref:Uncharacterized protein n=1 Tax=Pleurodeles waltl TaxID=8319 RepID=A0AAV7S1H7_PLEWA|nr:hypothetical protein NDU88_009815 [Pleurodeles waltl]
MVKVVAAPSSLKARIETGGLTLLGYGPVAAGEGGLGSAPGEEQVWSSDPRRTRRSRCATQRKGGVGQLHPRPEPGLQRGEALSRPCQR